MTLVCSADCPMRAVVINANGAMNDGVAKGLIDMANGQPLRG